jgi:signal transduction histidine kinase
MIYAATYWAFEELGPARVCFWAALTYTLPIFIPYLRNSVLALTNFLLLVGNATVFMVGASLGPYGIVLVPWCIIPFVIPLLIRDQRTTIFWWTLTAGVMIAVSLHFLYEYQPPQFELSIFYRWATVSFLGLMGMSVMLIRLSMEIARRSQKSLADSEHCAKILLSSLTHDMNNSLSLIKFAEEMISDLSDKTKSEKPLPPVAVNALSRGIEKAFVLVKQVQDMQNIRSGKAKLKREECSLNDLILETIEAMGMMTQAKKIQIKFTWDEPRALVQTNPGILKINILENIITNAIKFSYVGGEIRIHLLRLQGFYRITIRDFGVGMKTPDHLSAHGTTRVQSTLGTQGEIGAGLGMIIMKYFSDFIAIEVKSRSWLEAKDGEPTGTEFSIEIPIVPASSQPVSLDSRI